MASKRIAGITIEIGGDTTKLSKSLQGVDKQLSTTQSTLKDIDKLLKFNPGNVELLKQKQEALNTEVKTYKERLETLKTVTQENLSESEWQSLQREIIETEGKLKNAESQLKSFGTVGGQELQAVGKKITEIGSGISDFGKKLLPVTGALAGVGAASVAAAIDVDEGYDTIITKTGATGETLEGLQEQMDNIFANIPTDAETAGTAIGEVNTRFGLVGEELGTLSEDFIKFAEINDTDVNQAIDSVDKIMTQFGVDSKEADNVLGLLTTTGQNTGLSMDDLYSSLESNSSSLKELGLNLPESITLLGELESSGINTDNAMAGLKRALANATAEGKPLTQALSETVEGIKNAKTDTEALQIATELFGKQAAPEMAQAIREGRLDLEDLTSSMEGYGQVVTDTYNSTLDPWDQMTVATNNLKLAGADLAGSLFEVVAPAIEGITEGIRSATEWFTNLDDGTKKVIVTVGGIVAAIGPALIAIGGVVSTVGKITSAIGMLQGVMSGISAAGGLMSGALTFLTGPVGIAIAAIGGLIAVGILLYKNWDTIKEKLEELKKWIGEKWEAIKTGVSQTVDNIKTNVSEKWSDLKTNVSTTVDNIKTNVTKKWDETKSNVSTTVANIKTDVTNKWNTLKTNVTNKAGEIKSNVKDKFEGLKTNLTSTIDDIKSKVETKFDSIKSTISDKITGAKDKVKEMIDKIKGFFNFDFQWPSMPLPHFSVTPQGWKISDLLTGSIPSLGINWYGKAMERPALLQQPTIFGYSNGQLMGGGERGNEFVVGEAALRNIVRSESIPEVTIVVNGAPGQDVNELADIVSRRINNQIASRRAAYV